MTVQNGKLGEIVDGPPGFPQLDPTLADDIFSVIPKTAEAAAKQGYTRQFTQTDALVGTGHEPDGTDRSHEASQIIARARTHHRQRRQGIG